MCFIIQIPVFDKNREPVRSPTNLHSAVIPQNIWTLLKSLTGNLLLIPYHLTKFQTPSSNLANTVEMPLQRAITQEKFDRICSEVNRIICSSYPIS